MHLLHTSYTKKNVYPRVPYLFKHECIIPTPTKRPSLCICISLRFAMSMLIEKDQKISSDLKIVFVLGECLCNRTVDDIHVSEMQLTR